MRKIITAAMAALTLAGAASVAGDASARGYRGGHGSRGGAVAAGVIGGLALGAALGSRPYYYGGYPYYADPYPYYGRPCTVWRWDRYYRREVPVRTWC